MSKDINILKIQAQAFSRIGIDLEALEVSGLLKRPIRYAFLMSSVIIWALMTLSYAIKFRGDIDKFAEALTLIFFACLSILKVGSFLCRGSEHIRLIRELLSMSTEANDQERDMWFKEQQRCRDLTGWFYYGVHLGAFVVFCLPLIEMLNTYISNETTVYILPFQALYPFDYQHPIPHILTYAWNILIAIFMCYSNVGTECIFLWYIYSISAHFRILSMKLQCLGRQWEQLDSDAVRTHMISVFVYHRRVIDLADQLKSLFGEVVFAEVTLSCFKLCFCGYRLASGLNFRWMAYTITILLVSVQQLMIYCLSGERIKSMSELIGYELYLAFPWHRMNCSMRRLLLLPLMRSQRVSTVIGYFYIADHKLLVWVFNTAGSYLAMLIALKNSKA